MKKVIFSCAVLAVLLAGQAGGRGISLAAGDEPTIEDVEDARRCAAETRIAGRSFVDVRDTVRAGGTSRAQALLTVAEHALRDARSACRGNDEVSAQLEILSAEADELRRILGSR